MVSYSSDDLNPILKQQPRVSRRSAGPLSPGQAAPIPLVGPADHAGRGAHLMHFGCLAIWHCCRCLPVCLVASVVVVVASIVASVVGVLLAVTIMPSWSS